MQVADAFLAKYADVDADDMFTVVGAGFNEIRVPEFPCHLPPIYLVVRLRLMPAERGREQRIQISILDAAHQKLEGLGHDIQFTAPLQEGGLSEFTVACSLTFLHFKEPGTHTISLHVDEGPTLAQLPLVLAQGT